MFRHYEAAYYHCPLCLLESSQSECSDFEYPPPDCEGCSFPMESGDIPIEEPTCACGNAPVKELCYREHDEWRLICKECPE